MTGSSAAGALAVRSGQWVTFGLASEIYGIEVEHVQEVLRVTPISPVPGARPNVLGILSLRGSVVSVVDGRACLGLPRAEPGDASRILVVEVRGAVIGMLVDSVAEVVDVPGERIESSPGMTRDQSTVAGVCKLGEELLILLDLDRLLAAEVLD